MADLFEDKNISPMLLNQVAPFDDPEYIYELKLDGIRCIAYLDKKSVVLRNKRNKDVTLLYPELTKMHLSADKRCILDGELIALADGKPDFYKLQQRSLMSNQFKIKLAADRSPVQFVVYDILYLDKKEVTDLPLTERKALIEKHIQDGSNLSVSRYIEKDGIAFFELAKAQNLEGIVAKKKDGKYHIGKRTSDWVKIKVMQDEDCVICGYKEKDDGGIKDLILGIYEDKKLIYRGSVSLGISKSDEKIIYEFARKNKMQKALFPKQGVIWLKPELRGTVHYMHLTETGQMRQPVFKGIKYN